MVYDCFIFFNELEILDIRLNTLDKVVDKFILCESTRDHANNPKPLYFENNKTRFKKFKDKIVHIIVDDTPPTKVPWITINHQWGKIAGALKECNPNDIILFSDVDEIPKPERIIEWKNKPGKVKIFMQSLSYYYLNCVDYADELWEGTRMLTYKEAKKNSIYANKFLVSDLKIPDGGWHFSYIGDVKKIRLKVASSGHQEFNTNQYKASENIKMAIAEGRDFLNHGLKFRVADISFLPQYVLANRQKFDSLLIDKFEKKSGFYFFEKKLLQSKYFLRVIYRRLRKIFYDEKNFFNR